MRWRSFLAFAATIGCRYHFDPLADDDGGTGSNGGAGDGAVIDVPHTMPCATSFSAFDITASTTRSRLDGFAWNGTTGAALWVEDPTGASAMRYRKFQLDGTTDPIVDLGIAGPSESGHLTEDGASFIATWSNDTGRDVVRAINGAARENVSTAGSAFSAKVTPVLDGTAYAWSRSAAGTQFERRFKILDSSGGTAVNERSVGATSTQPRALAMVWSGSELAVFYGDGARLMMQRVALDGSMVGGAIELAAGNPSGITAEWTGDRIALAWHAAELRVMYVAADGTPLSPIAMVPSSTTFTYQLAIAVGPSLDLVIWQEVGDGVNALPVARDGQVGNVVAMPGYAIDAAWAGDGWALAVTRSPDPGQIEIRPFCP